MQELKLNQNGEDYSKYKQRIISHFNTISKGQYKYSDEIKDFLNYAINEILYGNKCILLQGNVGSGKSIVMRVLAETFSDTRKGGCIRFINSIDIVDSFRSGGYEGIKKYLTGNIVIDEVGLEQSPVKLPYESSYLNVIEYILLKRYDRYIDTGGKVRTHIVTNLSDAELLAFYGERVFSRIELMRSKKTVLGRSENYTDFRKLGLVFHYVKFDWEKYIADSKKVEIGDISKLIERSIEIAIEDYKKGKIITDAGGIKWKYLVSKGDVAATEIDNKESPSDKDYSLYNYMSNKVTLYERCLIKWIEQKISNK
jgi:hypothetical protein